jgi:glycosyltransferase involved in cell wall biosynthesis
LVVIGEGYEREPLENLIRHHRAQEWISLPGRVDDDELLGLYRAAWVVASASAREGWGMTLTEAAACGTPAVASRIAGHLDAVDDGSSGLLVDTAVGMTRALDDVLSDEALRARLSEGALVNAARFTWDATARLTFEILAAEAARRHARRR